VRERVSVFLVQLFCHMSYCLTEYLVSSTDLVFSLFTILSYVLLFDTVFSKWHWLSAFLDQLFCHMPYCLTQFSVCGTGLVFSLFTYFVIYLTV